MIINGYDTSALGLIIEDAPRWRDSPRRSRVQAAVPGRIGLVDLGARPVLEPRALEFTGVQKGDTAQQLRDRLDALKRRLERGELEIRTFDMSDRFYRGQLEDLTIAAIRPAFTQRAHRIKIAFLCDDPRAVAITEDVVAFTTATPMPLGSAPSHPVVRITTPTNPTIIYRNSAGVEQGRLALTISGVTWVEIDMGRGTIVDNTGADRIAALTSGTFLELDPFDGTADGTAHPTLEVTGGTGSGRFRKAW